MRRWRKIIRNDTEEKVKGAGFKPALFMNKGYLFLLFGGVFVRFVDINTYIY